MPAPIPRVPQSVRPGLGRHPPGVPCLSAFIWDLRFPPPLRDPPRTLPLLCARFRPDRLLCVLPVQHPVITEKVRTVEGQRVQARRWLLSPQDGTHPLAPGQGQGPHLNCADLPRWVGLHTQEGGQMAGLLVLPLDLHHPPFRQEARQSPGGLRGG